MSRSPHPILEDARHRLPRPRPVRGLRQAPFVGNKSINDNILECTQIALWNALGPARGRVAIALSQGHATLTGSVETEAERAAAEKAIAALECVSGITSQIRVKPNVPAPAEPTRSAIPQKPAADPQTMVFVTRYCSLERASMAAAIRDATAVLTAFLRAQTQAVPQHAFVFYYNQRADTITLDIGCTGALPAGSAHLGEIRSRALPSGQALTATPGAGLTGLLSARAALRVDAGLSDSAPMPATWQQVPVGHEPFAAGWQPGPLHLQIESLQ